MTPGGPEGAWTRLRQARQGLGHLGKGLPIDVPANYFKNDDPEQGIEIRWKGHANLFFANWLNYVYQETPYDLERLAEMSWDVEEEGIEEE